RPPHPASHGRTPRLTAPLVVVEHRSPPTSPRRVGEREGCGAVCARKTWLLGPVGRRRQFTTIGGTPGRFRSLTELAAVSLAWLRVSLIPFSTPCAAWGLPATAAAPPPSASEPPAALPVAVRPVSAVPAVAIGPAGLIAPSTGAAAAPSGARTPTMKAVIALAAASIVVLLSLGGAEGVRRQPIRISFG